MSTTVTVAETGLDNEKVELEIALSEGPPGAVCMQPKGQPPIIMDYKTAKMLGLLLLGLSEGKK
jgi:hypothetical protein